MAVDDAASDQSSSSLSPPPLDSSTPHNLHNDTITVARPQFGGGVANSPANPAQTTNAAAHANNRTSASTPAPANGAAPEKPKRQRKKKEVGADGKPVDDGKPKEKKPRAPRKPKDPNAPTTSRKRKIEETAPPHDAPVPARQSTLTEMANGFQQHAQPTPPTLPSQPQHRPSLGLPTSNPPTPRPISRGQNYDPVRGYDPVRAATMETVQQRPANVANGTPSAQTSPHVNRASASPSIASLIDPPMLMTKTSVPTPTYSSQTNVPFPQLPFVPSQPRSPTPPKMTPAAYPHPPRPKSPPPPFSVSKTAGPTNMDGAMDIDLTCEGPKLVEVKKAPSKSDSSAPTPKPARPTPPVVQATGSGLLSSSDLFGGPSTKSAERKGVNIDIQIKLNPAGGNTINIAHEIVKKYGRDAINPRAAAHREQLRQMMAMANNLDPGAADDMSVDITSDYGDDSNIEMGGMDDEKSGTNAAKPRRGKKTEEYDKEDDFIDDTELAWQEQAAVAKDGFFVYSGPLIPPGEIANIESAAPTRGSGRGRGRGSRSRGGASVAGATHASVAAEKNKDPNAPPTRARGRGRGTGAPRKPRITKADRERMEAEKMDRERVGQQQYGGPTGAPLTLAPTPQQQQQQTQQQQPLQAPPAVAVGYGGPTGTLP